MQKTRKKAQKPPLRRTLFVDFRIRKDIAEEFKAKAKESGLEYSDYLKQLMDSEFLEGLVQNSPYASSLTSIITHIAKRSSETAIRNYSPMKGES
jgi:hypothetical protein